jgi:hypothetical protein
MTEPPSATRFASERVLERARRMMKSDILPGRPDLDGLLTLVRTVFPGEDVGDPRFLPWLYDKNPGGRALEFIARNREIVTGHIALVPLRYKTADGTAMGSMAINAITHPDFRGRGIFIVLHDLGFKEVAAKNIPFTFGYANLNSEKGCLRHLGYRELTRIPLWILPFNVPKILASQSAKQRAGWRLAARGAQPLSRFWRTLRRPRRSDSIAIEKITEFGPDFDDLWAPASNTAENILIRDRAFLNWRFIQAPTRRYDLFAARSSGRCLGYLAGRTTLVEGLRWGMIVDLLTEDTKDGRDAASSLLAAYNRHILAEGADVAAALILKHTPPALALRRNGYIVCPPSFLPREFPVLLHWNMPGPAPPRLFDPKSWFITLADYDAV